MLAGPELDSSPDWGAYIQIFLLVSVRCPGSVLCCTALIRFLSTPFRFSIIVGLGYGRRFLVQGWLRRRRCPSHPSPSVPLWGSAWSPADGTAAPEAAANRHVRSAALRCWVFSCCPAVDRRVLHAARPASLLRRRALAFLRRSCRSGEMGAGYSLSQSWIVPWRLNWYFIWDR